MRKFKSLTTFRLYDMIEITERSYKIARNRGLQYGNLEERLKALKVELELREKEARK